MPFLAERKPNKLHPAGFADKLGLSFEEHSGASARRIIKTERNRDSLNRQVERRDENPNAIPSLGPQKAAV